MWVVGLEQTNPLFRKVSDNRVALRLDPEVFITPTEAYIYYYEYKQNGNVHPVALHKCSSGLGSFPLSVNEISPNTTNYLIYPNPAQNIINLQSDIVSDVTFVLYNTTGQLLMTGKNQKQIDVSALNPGIYFLQLTDKTGKSTNCRFIKD